MGQKIWGFWELYSDYILAHARNVVVAAVIIVTGIILSRAAQKLIKKAAASKLQIDGTVISLLRGVVR